MRVLVADTSVLVDLERGSLLEASFRLPFQLAVPDLLYEHELKDHGGEELKRLGLVVEELDSSSLIRAITFRREVPALSVPDCFAIALAQTRRRTLLTGDGALRRLADDNAIECHGVLWLLNEIHTAEATTVQELHNGLKAISEDSRCRLPKHEVRKHLTFYAKMLP